MWQVQENGKPCDCNHFKVHPSWNNATFQDLREAASYASKWFSFHLGEQDNPFTILYIMKTLTRPTPYIYNGYDTAQIVYLEE